MEGDQSGYLRVLRLDRAQAVQLVLVGLVLALGVDLIAGYLGAHLSAGAVVLIGVIAVAVALALALRSVYRPRSRNRRFKGFFIYDRQENVLVGSNSGYRLGEDLARYVEAGLAEDGRSGLFGIGIRSPCSPSGMATAKG